MEFRIGAVDLGGTFCDTIVLTPDGKIKVLKVPSNPNNPEKAIITSLDKLGGNINELIHGTTVAINALLQRKGAEVALITTKGFKDVIEIGRQNRQDIYDLVAQRPKPLVKPEMRYEVNERILKGGTIQTHMVENETYPVISKIIENSENIESIAINFLFSFANPEHENKLKQELSLQMIDSNITKSIPISISSEVNPEYREYERTSTTVMDAYIKPLVSDYIIRLNSVLIDNNRTKTLAIMKSSKGLSVPEGLLRKPVEILVSGLAGGVQAGELTARLIGEKNLITCDIGGTSSDCSLITNGKVAEMHSFEVDGLPISTTAVDVKTIGAGGGSIARISGGILKVGPESAGADPGPAAYNIGGDMVTTTDADLVYGILPNQLGGGILELDKTKSIEVLTKLQNELGITLERTVEGIRQVFHENIAGALRNVSTERGVDPRKYALLAFGGAGPVHGCEIADIIGITKVIIPPHPGIWSAFGLLGADYRYDVSLGKITNLNFVTSSEFDNIFEELAQNITKMSVEDGINNISQLDLKNSVSVRYVGQSFELSIPWKNNIGILKGDFIHQHRKEYGFASETEPMEVVALRTTGIIAHPDPVMEEIIEKPYPEPIEQRIIKGHSIKVYNREDLGKNMKITGPIIIDQLDCTSYIPQGWNITVDKLGFIIARRNL